jgi:hypothetical protein
VLPGFSATLRAHLSEPGSSATFLFLHETQKNFTDPLLGAAQIFLSEND